MLVFFCTVIAFCIADYESMQNEYAQESKHQPFQNSVSEVKNKLTKNPPSSCKSAKAPSIQLGITVPRLNLCIDNSAIK